MRIRVLLVLLLTFLVLASQAARLLVVDAPQPADAIIVLAGETAVRPAHAIELLRQGLAPRLFLDVQSHDALYDQPLTELAERYARSLPEKEHIAVCPITGLSTYAESDDVNRCLQPLGVHRVLIVTSASHTGRALRIFRQRLPQYQFSAAAAQDPTHFGLRWWTNREWAKTTLDEWFKRIWYEAVDRWR
jgi:biopolymer transport protein ExbD